MDPMLREVADRGCTNALTLAIQIVDEALAQGIVERVLGNQDAELIRLVDARDAIIDVIAYEEGDLTHGDE